MANERASGRKRSPESSKGKKPAPSNRRSVQFEEAGPELRTSGVLPNLRDHPDDHPGSDPTDHGGSHPGLHVPDNRDDEDNSGDPGNSDNSDNSDNSGDPGNSGNSGNSAELVREPSNVALQSRAARANTERSQDPGSRARIEPAGRGPPEFRRVPSARNQSSPDDLDSREDKAPDRPSSSATGWHNRVARSSSVHPRSFDMKARIEWPEANTRDPTTVPLFLR